MPLLWLFVSCFQDKRILKMETNGSLWETIWSFPETVSVLFLGKDGNEMSDFGNEVGNEAFLKWKRKRDPSEGNSGNEINRFYPPLVSKKNRGKGC
jgi:hypothetical protein